jgi:hypothetical protein
VISLLTTLPKRGPMRWRVAESVIFAYGFASSVPP